MFEEIEGATVHTQHGAVLGTPAFMAQEQARGRWSEVGERTDLWAAAATLFAMLAGEPVHAGGTPNEQLGRAMTVPARSLGSARADLPDALIRFVDRALEFEPARRWPSASAMRDALRVACPEFSVLEPSEPGAASVALASQPTGSKAATTTVSEIRSLDDAAIDRSRRGIPRTWARAMGIALVAVLAAVFALVVTGTPSRAPADADRSPSPPTAALGQPSAAPAVTAIAEVADAPPQPVSPELAKSPALAAEGAAPAASTVTSARPTPDARGRMIQGAPRADADRRSPPAHVAPPPNMFEIRH
jgi:serine/threonine-protein kinase